MCYKILTNLGLVDKFVASVTKSNVRLKTLIFASKIVNFAFNFNK